jgi:uncharacterized membrane protein
MGAVIAILALAPLNLIFVLGPFLALLGIAIAGWAVSFSFLLGAAAVLGVFFLKLLFLSVGFWAQISFFLFALGCIGAAVLGLLLMLQITRWFVLGTLTYLKWNLQFIKGRS